jgi:hypothetical protein
MFRHHGKAMEHDERRGAVGAGQGDQEADDTTRGGRGRTMQGKRVADDTTRGSSLVAMAEDGGTHPCGCLPTSTPLCVSRQCAGRRRGGYLL